MVKTFGYGSGSSPVGLIEENGLGVMDLDFEGEDGDDQGGVREAAVDRPGGRGVHQKDVSAFGTPEVKATTSAGGEAVMGAPAKFNANAKMFTFSSWRSVD